MSSIEDVERLTKCKKNYYIMQTDGKSCSKKKVWTKLFKR